MSNTELEVGSSVPDFKLPQNTGGEIALSDYRGKKIILFFVREYNWIQCRAHVAQLGRMNIDFVKAGVQILIILGDTLDRARRYAETLKTPFPVLADPERVIYLRFELTKNFIGIQRTASVIVDQNGVIQYIKRSVNPMTWLQESKELLQAVQF
jgi:thioredoxin-dependent peroxiredoxin